MKLLWEVEEYKYWAGLDKECWHGLNLLGDTFENAWELVEYLQGNNPAVILRVVKRSYE